MKLIPIPDLSVAFRHAEEELFNGLRELHRSTDRKVTFEEMAKNIQECPEEFDLATDLVSQYVDGEVRSDKLGHFIRTAMAYAFKAARLQDESRPSACVYLCHAYFLAGMAAMQYNLARPPQLRVKPYAPLKEKIMALVESRCPPDKWASLEEIWRSIEDEVVKNNETRSGAPGFSKDPKATFDRLAKKKRKYFETFLARPVKRGRPSKSGQRG